VNHSLGPRVVYLQGISSRAVPGLGDGLVSWLAFTTASRGEQDPQRT